MSDMSLPRMSSPLSSSPNRASLSRPDWPWSAARLGYHRASTSSLSSASTPVLTPSSTWDPRSSVNSSTIVPSYPASMSRQNTGSMVGPPSVSQEESTRQWNFLGFEWTVRDVKRLRTYIEGVEEAQDGETPTYQNDDFEVLKHSPIIGDKFKLEVGRNPGSDENDGPTNSAPQLSLYVTSLQLEFESTHEIPATIMAAVKGLGQNGVRAEWIFEYWSDWVFRHENEVWECSLPSLTTLLENPSIQDFDSLVLCVQVHTPTGPFYPQHPEAQYVPRDLLDGLEASLDNSNTGDVKFVCLEKLGQEAPLSPPPSETTPHSRRSSSSASSHSPFSSLLTGRKRVLYAHSDILRRRSDYFATMLSSGFSENSSRNGSERKMYTIVVEEADFVTIYWLLRYCYANWLHFRENDDPRSAVDGVGTGWSAKWLQSRGGGEWDWKTFVRKSTSTTDDHGDSRSVASGESLPSAEGSRYAQGQEAGLHSSHTTSGNRTSKPPAPTISASKTTAMASTSRPTASSSTSIRRPTTSGANNGHLPSNISGPNSPSQVKTSAIPLSIPSAKYSGSQYPISPRSQRNSSVLPMPDPHPHPSPPPIPASALSVYQLAHRYEMPKLASLALEHIMSTISPESSFALLLATVTWDDLRNLIEEYVVQHWDEVSNSSEFEHCLEEISSGEWGSDGGKTMTRLFRRLRSPSVFSRNG